MHLFAVIFAVICLFPAPVPAAKEIALLFGIGGPCYANVDRVIGDIGGSAHVEGKIGHVFGDVKGFIRGSVGTIEGSIKEGAYVFGDIGTVGGNVRGHVQGNIGVVRGSVEMHAHVNGKVGEVDTIDGSVGRYAFIMGPVGTVHGNVAGTVERTVEHVEGTVGPTATIAGRSADEYNQVNPANDQCVPPPEPFAYREGCSVEFMRTHGLSPARATQRHFFDINRHTRAWAYADLTGQVSCGILRIYGNGLCAWLEGSDPINFVRRWCPQDCRYGLVLANGQIVRNGRIVSLQSPQYGTQHRRRSSTGSVAGILDTIRSTIFG